LIRVPAATADIRATSGHDGEVKLAVVVILCTSGSAVAAPKGIWVGTAAGVYELIKTRR
jgi:hypothetical protein